MTDPQKSWQGFVQRWSRRKLAAGDRADGTPGVQAEDQAEDQERPNPDAPADVSSEPAVAAFDPASLPPIDSIDAASDIRAFLAPGVPIELTRAALRRAWVTDPTIRDFVGLAENQWDFTKPDGVPGFGSLELTPELRRMVAGLFGTAPASDARRSDVGIAEPAESSDKTAAPDPSATSLLGSVAGSPVLAKARAASHFAHENAAVQDGVVTTSSPTPTNRKHGGALPE